MGPLLAIAALALSFDLKDAGGVRHTSAELRARRATVFAFIAADCPLSNGYAPELARLAADYSGRGVAFLAVHSDPAAEAAAVRNHARAFGYPFPALLDPGQTLARQLRATVTPEVAVVSPEGRVLYRGRIDDRHLGFGKSRPRASRNDLRLALDSILAGQPVATPKTKATGCAIPFRRKAAPGAVTFSDVAPILYRWCAPCHRPGEAAPFSLLSYEDAARRAGQIAAVTASRYMPPWLPESGHGEFAGERRLSASEIETIRRWAEAGAPDGDAAAPAPPRFTKGWQLGKPDSEARVREPFQAPAEGPDLYQCFVIPLALAQDRHVRAIEFRPGNRRLVHHALLFQDRSGNAARRGSSYPCFGTPGFFGGALGGWSPGTSALQLPVPVTIQKGAALVLQLHFHPTGRPETDQSAVGLYFTDTPPRTRVMDIPLGSRAIDIPPGERHYRVRDHFTLPVAVRAVGIIPHAHYICREMEGVAVLPDGSRRPLIRIRDWNFNWQEQYRYSQPVPLPAGTRLEMEFTYDNSEDNPRNPNSPPRRVTWGPGTTDEMAGLHVQVIPENSEDLPELGQALWGKFMRSVGGGFYRRR